MEPLSARGDHSGQTAPGALQESGNGQPLIRFRFPFWYLFDFSFLSLSPSPLLSITPLPIVSSQSLFFLFLPICPSSLSLYLTPSPLSSLPRSAPLRLLFPVSPSNLSSPPPSPADCTGEPQRRTSGFNSVPISKDQVLGGRKVIGPDTPRSASFFWLAAPLRSSSLIFLLLCSFIIIIFNCLFDSFSFAGKVPSLSFYPLFYFIQD